MSDNVIRPDWVKNGLASLDEASTSGPMSDDRTGGAGGGPGGTDLAGRIATLEASLARLELSGARLEAGLAALATKADVALAAGAVNVAAQRLAALEDRTGKAERAIDGAMTAAIGKAIGPWQLPAILASCCAVVVAAAALLGWLSAHPLFHAVG